MSAQSAISAAVGPLIEHLPRYWLACRLRRRNASVVQQTLVILSDPAFAEILCRRQPRRSADRRPHCDARRHAASRFRPDRSPRSVRRRSVGGFSGILGPCHTGDRTPVLQFVNDVCVQNFFKTSQCLRCHNAIVYSMVPVQH
jgi:hypothetical protein